MPIKDEVRAACARVDQLRGTKKIALCYPGASFSHEILATDLIASELEAMAIPFNRYFLDAWGLNSPAFSKRYGKEAHQVKSIHRSDFYRNSSLSLFQEFGLIQFTHLATATLLDQIPESEFILLAGEGLNRSSKLYAHIGSKFPKPDHSGLYLPYSANSVFFYLWSQRKGREGEFNFFSSTPGLMAAVFQHPDFHSEYPWSDTSPTLRSSYPELRLSEPSADWNFQVQEETVWVTEWIESQRDQLPGLAFWERSMGCAVCMDELFL